MSVDDDGSDSFDPRSWLKERGSDGSAETLRRPAGGPARGQDLSFDPASWGSARAGEPAPSPAPVAKGTSAAPATPELVAARRARLLGVAGAATILLASLSGAWLTGDFGSGGNASQSAAAPDPARAVPAAPAEGVSRRTVSITGVDQLLKTLVDFGLPEPKATALAAQAQSTLGQAPGEIRLIVDLVDAQAGRAEIAFLEATRADGSGVRITMAADGQYSAAPLAADLETRVMSAAGEMDSDSFYSSAVAAGINDSLISDFAKAFSFDINFATDVKPGDVFEAAFEQDYNPAGEPVGLPRLLFVSLRTATKSLRYYRFTPPGEKEASWFDAGGRGNKRALMRTPVDGARITSNFGPRFHPVLHYTRLHGGTDFAAPVGTPIYAAAGGTVVSAAASSCAGNMVILRHDNGWETRYFHASRFADGITAGARVTQGQTIAFVGNTGTCTTGPHLHYEVHVEGQKVDPMSIDTSTSVPLEGDALAAFMRQRDRVDAARAGQTP